MEPTNKWRLIIYFGLIFTLFFCLFHYIRNSTADHVDAKTGSPFQEQRVLLQLDLDQKTGLQDCRIITSSDWTLSQIISFGLFCWGGDTSENMITSRAGILETNLVYVGKLNYSGQSLMWTEQRLIRFAAGRALTSAVCAFVLKLNQEFWTFTMCFQ